MTSPKSILVVDDDANVVRVLTLVLGRAGYTVAVARNGAEAMQKVREVKPALMLLDVMMPVKNGYEVCQEVKGDPALSDIYVMMLSARGQERDKEKGLKGGADEFVTKPFSPLFIVERVKAILG